MKSRKQLKHSLLIAEVMKQLQNFQPSIPGIKVMYTVLSAIAYKEWSFRRVMTYQT